MEVEGTRHIHSPRRTHPHEDKASILETAGEALKRTSPWSPLTQYPTFYSLAIELQLTSLR